MSAAGGNLSEMLLQLVDLLESDDADVMGLKREAELFARDLEIAARREAKRVAALPKLDEAAHARIAARIAARRDR